MIDLLIVAGFLLAAYAAWESSGQAAELARLTREVESLRTRTMAGPL
ncbi:MAG TPA: hypothetical protein VFP48_01640 [Steroidobacteraceae bacterium]|nr:hypothetical protein [Steroidobacteraceae bacterium]